MTDRYFEHQELIKRFKLLCAKQIPNIRIFDRTVGKFYAKRVNDGMVKYIPMSINRKGMADCYGLLETDNGLMHLEFEFKSSLKAKQTPAQITWQQFIESMGGLYLVVRNENIGIKDIREFIYG